MSRSHAADEAALRSIQTDMRTDGLYSGAIDADYGPASRAAFLLLRQQAAECRGEILRSDPALQPAPAPGTDGFELTHQDYVDAAAELGVVVATPYALKEVESGGGWFKDMRADILALDGAGGFIDGQNLPKILFEAHKFSSFTNGRYNATHPNISSPRWNRALYVGGQGEYARLDAAMRLDRRAALMSASAGLFQIMGFNYAAAGYPDVESFWAGMKSGERAQLMAFVNFVKNTKGLLAAARRVDSNPENCRDFARLYNGAGYATQNYHVKIATAYKRWL
jgi:hypothetical protein